MFKSRTMMALGSVAAALLLVSVVVSAEKEPAVKVALPAAAADALAKAFPKATVGTVKVEKEYGLTMYAVALTEGDAKMEVDVTAEGTIAAVETTIAAADLPKAAADAVAKAAPDAKVAKVTKEEVRAEAKLAKLDAARTEYELKVAKDGKEGEIKFAVDGAVVEELKWKDAKKEAAKGEAKEGDKSEAKDAAKVALSDKAADAVKKAFPQATVGKVKVEDVEGTKVFEAILTQDAAEMEVEVAEDGLIVEVETAITAKDLPAAVADAAAKALAGAEIKKVMKQEARAAAKLVQLSEAKTVFEVELTKDGKEGELKLSAVGAVLNALEWKAAEEDEKD
jgi:hypothetical protein